MDLLVLDDDLLVQQAMALALGKSHKIFQATTVAEAIKIAKEQSVDAAIVDIDLGGASEQGIDFLTHFKQNYPEKPAIMESGHGDMKTVAKCMKLGADDYIEKPFDLQTLLLRIDEILTDTKKIRA